MAFIELGVPPVETLPAAMEQAAIPALGFVLDDEPELGVRHQIADI